MAIEQSTGQNSGGGGGSPEPQPAKRRANALGSCLLLGYTFSYRICWWQPKSVFFNMGWRAGIAAGFALFLAVVYRQLFFSKEVWATILRRAKRWELLAVIIAYFDIALFAMSIRFVDVSATTIVAEISPLFLIIVMWFSYRKTETYQKPTLKLLFLVSIGLVGFAFVVFSESGEVSLFFTSQANWLLLLGISLALASALIAAFNGFSFKWGTDLKTYLPDEVRKKTTMTQ